MKTFSTSAGQMKRRNCGNSQFLSWFSLIGRFGRTWKGFVGSKRRWWTDHKNHNGNDKNHNHNSSKPNLKLSKCAIGHKIFKIARTSNYVVFFPELCFLGTSTGPWQICCERNMKKKRINKELLTCFWFEPGFGHPDQMKWRHFQCRGMVKLLSASDVVRWPSHPFDAW